MGAGRKPKRAARQRFSLALVVFLCLLTTVDDFYGFLLPSTAATAAETTITSVILASEDDTHHHSGGPPHDGIVDARSPSASLYFAASQLAILDAPLISGQTGPSPSAGRAPPGFSSIAILLHF